MMEADQQYYDESSSSNDVEIKDKATNKEAIELVILDNINIMEIILEYKERVGVYPFDSPIVFKRFCYPFVSRGIGNTEVWTKKVREIKNKFNDDSAPIEDVDKKEFKLWKKIWGDEVGADSSK
ncbi:unnamed protein product [Lactuca saligna]|uniref:Uncharacterized protein n=1 Tax=Lactuca saligna TaxID=75948 RepID=A0AA35V2N5_LACSI|nr:unnamed protein product [Lactuca saligna]